MKKKLLILGVLAACFLVLAALTGQWILPHGAEAFVRMDESFSPRPLPGGRIEITGVVGSVFIRQGEEYALDIRRTVYGREADKTRFTERVDGDVYRYEYVDERLWSWTTDIGERLELTVTLPKDAVPLSVRSVVGKVQAQALEAPALDLDCAVGDIALTDVAAGRLAAVSGTGNLQLARVRAREADLRANVGDIRMDDCALEERLAAASGTGSVRLETVRARKADLRADVGDIRLRDCAPEETLACTGKVGNIEAALRALPQSMALETDVGNIVLEIPAGQGLTVTETVGVGKFRSEVSQGQARVSAATNVGNIHIRYEEE